MLFLKSGSNISIQVLNRAIIKTENAFSQQGISKSE